MKLSSSSSSMPITSPGRAEKFPPPLMRFLRSNVGSRSSRGKRSSMFLGRRKKKKTTASAAAAASAGGATTQEPSSPKVTCIGQVRVRRSKNSKKPHNKQPPKCTHRHCCCCFFCFSLRKPNFCCTPIRWNWPSFPTTRKLISFFNCRSVKVRTDSSRNGSNWANEIDDTENEEDDFNKRGRRENVEEERGRGFDDAEALTTTTSIEEVPPKNALLLTRCRSAPYRSSSLACRFWSSPLKADEEEREEEEEEDEEQIKAQKPKLVAADFENRKSTGEGSSNAVTHASETGPLRRDSTAESRGDQEREREEDEEEETQGRRSLGIRAALLQGSNSRIVQQQQQQQRPSLEVEMMNGVDKQCPLVLTRCKSEPASRGSERLMDPQSGLFWRRDRRLGNTQSSSPRPVD